MFASVFLFFCCCCTAAVCKFETKIERFEFKEGFKCIKSIRPLDLEEYENSENLVSFNPPGYPQTSLTTTILAAYMDPVRCSVEVHKQETNHPNSIALNRNKLMNAIWIQRQSWSKSSVCVVRII